MTPLPHGHPANHRHRHRPHRRLPRSCAEETPLPRPYRGLRSRPCSRAGARAGSDRPRLHRSRRRHSRQSGDRAGHPGRRHSRFNRAPGPRARSEDAPHRYRQHQRGSSGARDRRIRQADWPPLPRRTSHGGKGTVRHGIRGCRSVPGRGLAFHSRPGPEYLRRPERRVSRVGGSDRRTGCRHGRQPSTTSSAPGSAICRK